MREHFKVRSAKDFMQDLFDDAYETFFSEFSLQMHMLWVLIWIASTCRGNSNEFQQHMCL